MQVVLLPPRAAPGDAFVETGRARAWLVAPDAPAPPGADALVPLPDGHAFAYGAGPAGVAAPAPAPTLALDPFVRGNAFRPLHESPRALCAQLGIAAGRRVDTGPESERMFLVLRGSGLVFDQAGETLRFGPESVVVVPAGEAARLWAQGPEDVLAVACQPKGETALRRTLRSEIERRRAVG